MKKKDLQKKKKDNKSPANRSDSTMAGKSNKKEESKSKPLKSLEGGGRVTRESKKIRVSLEEEHVQSVDLGESADGGATKQTRNAAAQKKLTDKDLPVRTTRSRVGAEVAIVASSPVKKTRSGGANTGKDDGVKKDVPVPVRTTRTRASAEVLIVPSSPVGKKRRRGEVDAENDEGVKKEIPVRTTRSRVGAEVAGIPSSPVDKKKRRIGGLDTESGDGAQKEIPVRATRSRGGVELSTLNSSPVEKKETRRGVKTDIEVKKDVPIRTTRSRMDAEIASLPSPPAEKKKIRSAGVNAEKDDDVKNVIAVRTTRSRTGGEIASLPSFPVEKKETRRGVKTDIDDGVEKEIAVRTTRSRVGAEIAILPSSPVEKKNTRRGAVNTENDDVEKAMPVRTTRSRIGGAIVSVSSAPVEKKKTIKGGVNTDDDGGVEKEMPVRTTRSRAGAEKVSLPSSSVEKKKITRVNTENDDGVKKEMLVRTTRSRVSAEVTIPPSPVGKKETRRGVKTDNADGVKEIPVRTMRSKVEPEIASLPPSPVEKTKTTKGRKIDSDDGFKKTSVTKTEENVVRVTRTLRGKETSLDGVDMNYEKTDISSRKRKRGVMEDMKNEDEVGKIAILKKNTRQTRKKGNEQEGGKADLPRDKDVTDIQTVKEKSKNSLALKEKAQKQSKRNASTSEISGKRDLENVSKLEPTRRSRRTSPTESELVEGDLETMGNTSALKKATDLSTSIEGRAKTVSEINSLEEDGEHIGIQVIQVEPINDIDPAAEKTINVPGEISHSLKESEMRNEEISLISEESPKLNAGETSAECNTSGAKNVGGESEKVSVKDYTSSLEDKTRYQEPGEPVDDHVVTSEADNAKIEELVDNASKENFSETTHLEIGVGESVEKISVFQQINELGQTDPSVDVGHLPSLVPPQGSPRGMKDISVTSCTNSGFIYNESREATEANEITAGALECSVKASNEKIQLLESNSEDVGETSIVKSGEEHVREGASTMFHESRELLGNSVIAEEHHHCDSSSPVSQAHALGNIGFDFEDVGEASVVKSQEGLEKMIEEVREENCEVLCEVVEKNVTLEASVEEFGEEHVREDASMMVQVSPELLEKPVIFEEHHIRDTGSVETPSSPVSKAHSLGNVGIEFEDVTEASVVRNPKVLETSIEESREENCDCDSDKLNVRVSCEVDEKNETLEASVVGFGEEHVREDASRMFQDSPDLLGKTVTIEEYHGCDTNPINTPSSPVSQAQTPVGVGLDLEDVDEISFVKSQEVLEEKIEEVRDEDIIKTSVVEIQEVLEEKMEQVRDKNSDGYSDKLDVKFSSQVDENNEILEASLEEFGEEHVHEDTSVMFLESPELQGERVIEIQEVLEEKMEQVRDKNSDGYSDKLNVEFSSQVDEKNEILEASVEEFGEDHVHEDPSVMFLESPELQGERAIVEEHNDCDTSSIKTPSSPVSQGNAVLEFEDDVETSSVKSQEVSEEKNEEVRNEDVTETSVVKSQEVLEENIEEVREENCDYNRDTLNVKTVCEIDENNENVGVLREEFSEEHVRDDASVAFQESPELLAKSVMIEDCDCNTSSSVDLNSAVSLAHNPGIEEFESEADREENIEEVREENCDGNSDKLNVNVSCDVDEKNETPMPASVEEVGEVCVASMVFQESQELLGESVAIEEHADPGTRSIETLSSPVWQAHTPGNVGLDFNDVSEAMVAKSQEVLEENIEEIREENFDCNLDEQNVKVSCEDEKEESLEASAEFGAEPVREDASTMFPKAPVSQEFDFKDVGESSFLKSQEFLEEKIEALREENYDRNSEKLNMKVSCEVDENIETLEASLEEFGEEHVGEDASMMLQEIPEYRGKSIIVEEHHDDNCDRNLDKLNMKVSCEVDENIETLEASLEEFGEEHVGEDASMMLRELPEYRGKSIIVEEHHDDNCDRNLDKHNVIVSCEKDEVNEILEAPVEEAGEEHAREDVSTMVQESLVLLGNSSVEEFGEEHVKEEASMIQESPEEYPGKRIIIEEHPDENCDHSSDKLNVKVSCEVDEEIETLDSSVEEFSEGHVGEDASMMFQESPEEYPGKSVTSEEHPDENCDHSPNELNVKVSCEVDEEMETLEASGEEFGEGHIREDVLKMFQMSPELLEKASVGQSREEHVREDASMMFRDSPDLLGSSVRIDDNRDCYASGIGTSQAHDSGNVEIYFKDFDDTSFENYQDVLEGRIEATREENYDSNLEEHNLNVSCALEVTVEEFGVEHAREDASMMFQELPELHGKSVNIEEHQDCDTSAIKTLSSPASQDNAESEDNLPTRENNDWTNF